MSDHTMHDPTEQTDMNIGYMARNGSSVIIGKIVIFLIAFCFISGLANFAGKDTVGNYTYITSVLAIVSIATLPGMPSALMRAIARGKEGSLAGMTRHRLVVGLFGSVAALVIGAWYMLYGDRTIGISFLVAAPFVPLTDTMSDMAFAYWQGRKRITKSMVVSVAYQALFTVPSLVLLFLTRNLPLIVAGILFFQFVAGYLVYRRIRPTNAERDAESERFGFHLSLMNVLRTINKNVDTIVVWYMFGPIFLATYTFAITPANKIDQLVPIEQVTLPLLTQKTYSPRLKRSILKKMGVLFLIELPFFLALYLLAPFAYHLLFPKFPESVPLFRALILAPFCAPFLLLKTSFTAWHMQGELYAIEIISLLAKVVLIIVLGIAFGAWGLVAGVVGSRVIESAATLLLFMFRKPKEAHGIQ